MRYTLRQLEVFLATATHSNISRAAESLNLSQSAASHALKELEAQYDVQLFDRVGKRLKLNEQGAVLRPMAAALLSHAGQVERGLEGQLGGGDLQIGATLTIGNYLAVGIVAAYMAEHPNAGVDLQVANTETIVNRVLNYELDIGLIEGEVSHKELHVEAWQADELQVFCAPEHPLAKRKKITDQQIIELPWVLREQGSGTRQTFDRGMHGLLPELNVVLELQHTEAIKRAVESGLGVGCLSQVALRDAFARGSLVPVGVPHRDFSRNFYFIWHRQKFQGNSFKRWLELCRAAAN